MYQRMDDLRSGATNHAGCLYIEALISCLHFSLPKDSSKTPGLQQYLSCLLSLPQEIFLETVSLRCHYHLSLGRRRGRWACLETSCSLLPFAGLLYSAGRIRPRPRSHCNNTARRHHPRHPRLRFQLPSRFDVATKAGNRWAVLEVMRWHFCEVEIGLDGRYPSKRM